MAESRQLLLYPFTGCLPTSTRSKNYCIELRLRIYFFIDDGSVWYLLSVRIGHG
jgi:hypothetical protein